MLRRELFVKATRALPVGQVAQQLLDLFFIARQGALIVARSKARR
jgi:hypothetical protein